MTDLQVSSDLFTQPSKVPAEKVLCENIRLLIALKIFAGVLRLQVLALDYDELILELKLMLLELFFQSFNR